MKYAILLPADGKPSLIEFDKKEGLDFYYKNLNCDLIDIVGTIWEDAVLVVDDEGLFKQSPQINFTASVLYGIGDHGQPIVGDALLCTNAYTPDGVETVGFEKEKAETLLDILTMFTPPIHL